MTLGILVTWPIGAVTAYLLFDLSFEVALVLGAVLVVSGPTVVGPLLDFIRPSKNVNLVLKWEGTLADPIILRTRILLSPTSVVTPTTPRRCCSGVLLPISLALKMHWRRCGRIPTATRV